MMARWKHEYLSSLRERFRSKEFQQNIKLGEIVLISDDITPRLSWKLGLITKLFPGPDGYIRSVELRTQNGLLLRPVSKLYPLEVQCTAENFCPTIPIDVPTRPVRLAAIKASEKLKNVSY